MEGILLVNKTKGKTSFSIVHDLRKKTGIRKIGHCGTLDPFASGVMIMLLGKTYTKKSKYYSADEKEYLAEITLGKVTKTFDTESDQIEFSPIIQSIQEIENTLSFFQGNIYQTPPMFSAKKIKEQKLYHLARKDLEIERPSVKIFLNTRLISYDYPLLNLQITCSKGTYIRSIAHDLGQKLSCGGFLSNLTRIRSGSFHLRDCIDQKILVNTDVELNKHLKLW